MARTIGKRNMSKVKTLVDKAYKNGLRGYDEVCDYVVKELPQEVFETWESAHDEIVNIAREHLDTK